MLENKKLHNQLWIIDRVNGHNFGREPYNDYYIGPNLVSVHPAILCLGSHFGCRTWSPDTILEVEHSKSITSQFGPVVLEKKMKM